MVVGIGSGASPHAPDHPRGTRGARGDGPHLLVKGAHMTKRELVIGSQTGGLSGPIGDAERMAAMLEELGFDDKEIELCVDAKTASRSGIIEGYRRLIERTQKGDAALVYYSGHGARVLSSSGAVSRIEGAPVPLQALV